MKSNENYFQNSIRKMALISILFLIAFSCSKNDNNPSKTSSFCGTMSWTNTNGQSGTFKGKTVNGNYVPLSIGYNDENGGGTAVLQYDSKGHLMDQQEVTFTYVGDTLSVITYTGDTGKGLYKFDSMGHFIGGQIFFTAGESGLFDGVYTYDSNGDPTYVYGVGGIDDSNGHTNINLDITGSFLLNKTSLLPNIPVLAPFSAYFSFIPVLSKHLIDSWDVKITGSRNGVPIPENHFVIKYTYTYDSNGNVATMVNSGNSNNKYTFTYSDCK